MRIRYLGSAVAVLGAFLVLDFALSRLPYGDNFGTEALEMRTASGWIRELQDADDPTRRARAADALWQFGESVVAEITPCLHHRAGRVRSSACLALTRIGPEARAALPALLELVKQPKEAARLHALEAIESIGGATGPEIEILVGATRDPDASVRYAAVRALGKAGESAVPNLLELLQGGDPETLRWTVDALGQSSTPSRVICKAIAPYAEHADAEVRQAVFAALSSQGTTAVEDLLVLLDNDSPGTRASAAMAFCRMGSAAQPATGNLLDALNDEDSNVRFWSLRALGELDLGRLNDREPILLAVDDIDADVRWQALEVMSKSGFGATGFVLHRRGDETNQ